MNGAAARERALSAARAGDRQTAARLFAKATAASPSDALLLNSAGNFHAGIGDAEVALQYFDRALCLNPAYGEAGINRAVILTRLGRPREAVASLETNRSRWHNLPRYWTTRAAAEIEAGDKAAAAASYDHVLRLEPTLPRALAGRAGIALERGEPDAIGRHHRALKVQPGDPHLLLGLANSFEAAGQVGDALMITSAFAAQLPDWLPGMERHAAIRHADGDRSSFCNHYALAAPTAREPAFFLSWAATLAGVGQFEAATAVVKQGRKKFADDPDLALAAASHLDAAGDHGAAAALFARERRPTVEWQVHEARHLLRRGDPAGAEDLLAKALAIDSGNVVGWSLRDVAWRLQGDPRHDWLSKQPGLVAILPLDLDKETVRTAMVALDTLHDHSATPIGQSVRHGSQTRGALFDRIEPIIALLAAAITTTLECYRRGLPPSDPTHPLLRYRDAPWLFAGSWSIRMVGAGRHAAHVHPQGIVSSAAYIVPPDPSTDDPHAGWLEIGRPPEDLGQLLPLTTIQPREGHLALFPSTLFHGTRPIAHGRRMTVAFDVGAG